MPKDEKPGEPKAPKKPYRKPEIMSGKYPEKRALACGKTPGGPAEQGCGPADFTS